MFDAKYKLTDIKYEAMDSPVYQRGVDYYHKNMIVHRNVEIYEPELDDEEIYEGNEFLIRTEVKGSGDNIYDVEIIIDSDGDIDYYNCDCPSYVGFGACKHIVATLLDYKNNKDGYILKSDDRLHEPSGYTELINIFDNQVSSENSTRIPGHISLVPILVISYDSKLSLSFKIGESKLYVVKNALELFDNIKNKRTVAYGKSYSINHDINNFDDKSRKLIMFLTSICRSIYAFDIVSYQYANYSYYNDKKLLSIERSRIDDFFEFFRDEEIKCEISFSGFENCESIKFIEQNPLIIFKVDKHDNEYLKFSYSISEDNNFQLTTARNRYIINTKYLYKWTDDLNKNISPVIESLYNNNNSILVPANKYNIFYSTVIKHLNKYCDILIDDNINIELIDEVLVTELYLDVNYSGAIELEIMFSYGDIKFNPLDVNDKDILDKLLNIVRDVNKEKEIIKTIRAFYFEESNGKYILQDEERIYDFLFDGIKILMEKAYINVTDKFKNIEIKNPGPISMGVKISNNLIELNIGKLDFDYNELKAILKKYKQRKKYHRLKDGSFVNINDEYFDTLEKLIEDCNISEKELSNGVMYVPKYRSLYLEKLMKNSMSLTAKRSDEFKLMTRNLINIEDYEIEIPKTLNATLRKYQENGFVWLKTLANYSLSGILADDMGLGKTLQIISLLSKDKEEAINKTVSIVVCPASLIYNWQAEVEKFAPILQTLIISGSANQRRILLEEINDYDLIITSYDSVKRDVDLYSDINFKYCIVDEAQYIKNSNTQNSAAVKSLNGEVRFALTGTPIENSLSDLWSIFDFIMPGFLLSYNKFREKYESPIVKNNDIKMLDKLNTQIKPFILRRVKKEVLKELPDKIETISYAQMSDEQRDLYNVELMKANEQFVTEISANGFDNSHIKILALLTRLRQLCCHPSLYIENYNAESAKLELCMETAHNYIANGHKMLIFSQFTSMLDIIGKRLEQDGVEYYVLTGKTNVGDRLNLTNKFNQNKVPVFLISLKAGGTGLNLTGADVVIHYDPWWNTSAQRQATDRTHRIGQVNKVNVINLIVKDSIEEKIEILQRKKQSLIDSVITEKEVIFSSLTQEEIQSLLEV